MNPSSAPTHGASRHAGRAHRAPLRWSSLLLSLGLAACGGSSSDGSSDGSEQARLEARSRVAAWPLLDDEGLAMPSVASPADPAVRTRAQRYASVEQAEMLVAALGPEVVQVEVGCCGADVVSQAVQRGAAAQAAQAALTRPAMPVLVSGADLPLAAEVADRLAENSMAPVFLVTR